MVVRIPPLAALEAPHCKVWSAWRVWNDGGHHHAHVELGPERYHVRGEIGPVADEVEPHLPELVVGVGQRLLAVWAREVQAMHIVRRIVRTVLGPPNHRYAAQAHLVHHPVVAAQESHAGVVLLGFIQRAHPGRPPGHVTHSARGLLGLIRPVHGRGAHVSTYRHQLVHQHADGILVLDHFPKLRLGGDAASLDTTADPAHDVALHGVAFPLGLPEKYGVHERPDLPVPT